MLIQVYRCAGSARGRCRPCVSGTAPLSSLPGPPVALPNWHRPSLSEVCVSESPPQYWLFPANPRCRAVNRKDREFVVGLFGSPNRTRTNDLLVDSRSGTVGNTSPRRETAERPSLRAQKQ